MNIGAASGERQSGAWPLVERLCAADGSASHAWCAHLSSGTASRRDLADAVHALCLLHGSHPGVADDALLRSVQPDAGDWLAAAAAGFAAERAVIAALVSAAGPLPSTPGHAMSEAAILAQRHALEMLARSDRRGCATGTVSALLLDWHALRPVLDIAAEMFGIDVAPPSLPSLARTAAVIAMLGDSPACERAIGFGAQQLLAQHRGFWSLLDARASARGG